MCLSLASGRSSRVSILPTIQAPPVKPVFVVRSRLAAADDEEEDVALLIVMEAMIFLCFSYPMRLRLPPFSSPPAQFLFLHLILYSPHHPFLFLSVLAAADSSAAAADGSRSLLSTLVVNSCPFSVSFYLQFFCCSSLSHLLDVLQILFFIFAVLFFLFYILCTVSISVLILSLTHTLKLLVFLLLSAPFVTFTFFTSSFFLFLKLFLDISQDLIAFKLSFSRFIYPLSANTHTHTHLLSHSHTHSSFLPFSHIFRQSPTISSFFNSCFL